MSLLCVALRPNKRENGGFTSGPAAWNTGWSAVLYPDQRLKPPKIDYNQFWLFWIGGLLSVQNSNAQLLRQTDVGEDACVKIVGDETKKQRLRANW